MAEEYLSEDSHVILIEGHDCNFMSVAGRLLGFGLGVLVELDGCIRYRDERLGGRAESWTDLCHPTFAMTGALAWRVKKNLNKK